MHKIIGFRNSCSWMFYKIDVIKYFTKFTGKHFCQSFLFNRNAGQSAILFKNVP